MDYRSILKSQLERRQQLNPRFSLRSFSLKLGLSASKLSEVLSGKKKLSVERVEEIANNLSLKGLEREIFITTAELESKSLKNKEELQATLKTLIQSLKAENTQQRNAWYFGATKAFNDAGLEIHEQKKSLGLTELQIENANRFLKRIKKNHPERENITFEPSSLMKKINQAYEEGQNQLDADFAFLSEEQIKDLNLKIRSYIKKIKLENSKTEAHLQMIYFGSVDLLRKD